jgi:tetraacyldisaccharide 4'-kinase
MNNIWYDRTLVVKLLSPLSWVFQVVASVRRTLHQKQAKPFDVPVVVIGNISLGGTGKTPLLILLGKALLKQKYKVGVVSRGYGGTHQNGSLVVTPDTSPTIAGDEPVLIASKLKCPVVINVDRTQAVKDLLAHNTVDIVLSDDGLQHYKMHRDFEIAVVDGVRGLGNGLCLPAGPLREAPSRLQSVDAVVVNTPAPVCKVTGMAMTLVPGKLVNLKTGKTQALSAFKDKMMNAVAAIGHPDRFFDQCEAAGMKVLRHHFPDHHAYQASDLAFNEHYEIVMTEKDAIKCKAFATEHMWAWPVEAKLDGDLTASILSKIMPAS